VQEKSLPFLYLGSKLDPRAASILKPGNRKSAPRIFLDPLQNWQKMVNGLPLLGIRICHLTSGHKRIDGRIFQRACVTAAEHGASTTLIVADEQGRKKIRGVTVLSVGGFSSRWARLSGASLRFLVPALRSRADILHFHDPELLPLGLVLKALGRRVIFDMHEDLPSQLRGARSYIPGILRNLLAGIYSRFEGCAVRVFDAVCVPQPSMYRAQKKVNPETVLILNSGRLAARIGREPSRAGKYSILHAGVLSAERGLYNMLAVMEELGDQYTLLLAGRLSLDDGETFESLEKRPAWKRVRYLGILNGEEVHRQYSQSDLGLILYRNVGQYGLAHATKLFEFMAAGIPVVMPDFGEWPKFNADNKCGVCVDVESPVEVASAIRRISMDPRISEKLGFNGQMAVRERYDWKHQEERLVSLYRRITKK
jgi:glycosyltransferase involved in cell wall biosynthesis